MGLFGRERIEAKTHEQVVLMRAAGLLVGQTLRMLQESVRPGMTTKELDALAEAHIRDGGGIPNFLGYHGAARAPAPARVATPATAPPAPAATPTPAPIARSQAHRCW